MSEISNTFDMIAIILSFVTLSYHFVNLLRVYVNVNSNEKTRTH